MRNEDINFIDNSDKLKDKISKAKELIDESKSLVFEVDSSIHECQLGVSKSANDFDIQKRAFLNEIFKGTKELLKKVGIEYGINKSLLHESFELSVDSSVDNIEIENISSGRFTGVLLALIMGTITLFGWIYFSTKYLNISLENINLKLIESNMDAILRWIGGGIIGLDGDPMIGALILGFSVLIIAWVVYALHLNFKTDKNLRIAKKAYIESRAYSFSKDECKKEMLRVDAHLREAIIVIENFTVILNEQNGILKRIVYVEGIINEEKDYHPSSKKVMRETLKIMKSIETLLNTSVTKNGKLNPESQKALAVSKAVYAEFIGRIYD